MNTSEMSSSTAVGIESQRGEIAGQYRTYLAWYFAFFVISGFCGLVYEVIWVRLAMASYGVTTALASIVLSIFMGGLGLGSWLAGILVRRISQMRPARGLHLYSLTELLIGCSAILVPLELKLGRSALLRTGSLAAWQTWHYYVLAGAWLVITLLPWCTLLGATFPLLMSVIKKTCGSASDRSFSFLYLANVLGALWGTLVSAFVLIELLGFQGTLWLTAALNATLAFLAYLISRRVSGSRQAEWGVAANAKRISLYGLPRSFILLLLFSTGLVSMGCEVVWMRQFTPFLGNFVYAFALILATYLAATVWGARDYRRWSNTHSPNRTRNTWNIIAVATLIPVLGANPLLNLTPAHMSALRILSIVLFCALTGFITPLLVDAWSNGEPDKAGLAYAFNILGCILGPLVASFLLEPWLGERWSILAFSLPLFAMAGVLTFHRGEVPENSETPQASEMPGPRRMYFAAAVIVGVALFRFSNDFETKFPVREVRRDYAATVIATGTGFERELMVNGSGMTVLTPITKFIAHLPLASMNRPPKNGLVICFGMGTSFRSMLSWGIPTTAVDLIPSVPKLFPYYHSDAAEVMGSPLAHVVVDDGRRYLDGSNQTYDVIVVDPPPPVPAPGSSLLYSREFYEVVKRHLSPDGILQNWYPAIDGDDATAASIAKTLTESFPYVRAFRSYDRRFGIHFLASMSPIPELTASDLASRMPAPAADDLIEWGPAATPAQEFKLVLSQEIPLKELIARSPRIPPLSDDQPINEYFLLRRWFGAWR
jgi:predicted membrane-bound spermidine synthase